MKKKKISIITDGTYGDVLPFIFLTKELKIRGHDVSILTSEYYNNICNKLDVNLVSVTKNSLREKFLNNKDLWSHKKAFGCSINYAEEIFKSSIEDIIEQTSDSDLIIAHSLTVSGKVAAKINNKKYVSVAIAPICVKSLYRLPVFFGGINFNFLPYVFKKYFYKLGYFFVLNKYFKNIILELKKIGIDSIKDPLFWGVSSEMTIGLWPNWYLNVQKDQKEFLQLSGFTKNVEYFEDDMDRELEDWLKKKDTIVITMGSGYLFLDKWKSIIEKISKKYDCNCLVLTPENINSSNNMIRYVKRVPLSKVLPLCKLCIHHGGAGMVAQVINSGTPSVVVPMAHDQPDNGYLLEKLGVGKVVWMKEPKENIILNAIDLVLSSEEIKKANKKYSKLVQESKNGISKTADYIEDYID